ncbi:MAG: InlB B-repeat-containing protein, partial [Paludibacteraceae bacterium]|nr:InlB B-repeat-containing protein [Paludibacteraceae bacterium]
MWATDPDVTAEFTSTTKNDYFKDYVIDASNTVTLATSASSISSGNGGYYFDLSSNSSAFGSNYLSVKVTGDDYTIASVQILATGSGNSKSITAPVVGWEDGWDGSSTTADDGLTLSYTSASSNGGKYSTAEWREADVSSWGVKEIRIYKKLSSVTVTGYTLPTTAETLRIWGIKVWLQAAGGGSTNPVSSVTISGATTGYATIPVALTATPDETANAFQWFVDGVEQDGQTAAKFNFTATTPGTYSIVAKARNDYNDAGVYIASSAHTVTISKLCGELIKIVQNGQNDGTVTGILTGTKDVKLSSGTSEYDEKTGRKIGSDNYWLGITSLSKPLRAGDVATVFVTTASAKLQLFSDKGTTLIGEMASGVVQGENEIVLNSSATGATAIYLYRTTTAGSDMNPYVYSLSVNRSCEASTDCSISNVTINSEAITPVGKVYSYEVAAASALTEVAVTYSIHPLATAVPASGFTVAVPTAGDPANTQTITVTAEDGTHSDTYTISVSKATAASDVVTLDALAVTGYTLSPVFEAATLAYTITKDYGTADPTTDKVTFTKSEEAQKVDVVYDGTNHKFVVTVTAEDNTTTQDYEITINEAEAKRGLLTVPFSNGAKGAINAAGLEIRVPYIGASEPTIVLAGIEYQSGVSGASASMEAGKLRITGEDSNYDDYTITFVQLTPSALTLDELVTFDAVPSYAFAPYDWDSGKGVKFAKNVEEASNHRVSLGNTRVYFAIQACDEVQLTSGSGGARNVNIYVNGVLSSVDKTAASGSAIKLALDNTQANFIAIESNQTGGDGGFTKILVKALAANTLAYDNGAYTTGDAALDLSTLISTSNSDGAITYAVKTDGGTNASIAGNNFTATVAGTATITATQVASETIRQKSVDFNVVVTAGATKYTVTFDAQGGSDVDPQEVTEGESPVVPTAPTKDEYIFQGWSETTDGAVVDVTSFTINAPKTFYAIWVAEPAGIKLLDGSTVNHTNFITGVTADETVEFKGNTVNYAKFSGTVSAVTGVKDLTRVIAYNATTTQTKIRISAHNNSTSARNILVKGVVEGSTDVEDLATIALGNKEDKVSDWITFDNAANRTIYIMVPSSAGDVYFTQVKVIESGTALKMAGEDGYSLNLNQGRPFGVKLTDIAFEGFHMEVTSDYQPINSTAAKLKATSASVTVAAPVTMTVTTGNAATYYVGTSASATTNETAKTGASEFNLTAGTWYINAGANEVQLTNIAFSAPKCEQPTITTQPATKIDVPAGDMTATVVAEVSDGGSLSYKWYNASDDSEVAGATSAT